MNKNLHNVLLNHLTGIRSNFVIGLQFWAILKNPDTAKLVMSHKLVVKPDGIYAIPPGKTMHIPEGESFYTSELGGPKQRNFEHASLEYAKMHLRNFTTEMFEKVKAHCEDGGHSREFKEQDWYQYARMVRNSLTHDQHWQFNKYDKSILPVSWRSKAIELSMDETEMTWDFYDPYDALDLWDVIYDFSKSLECETDDTYT